MDSFTSIRTIHIKQNKKKSKRVCSKNTRRNNNLSPRERRIPRKTNSPIKFSDITFKTYEDSRCDAYGTPIKKGGHKHKVSFIDELYRTNIAQIEIYEEEEDYTEGNDNIKYNGNQKSNSDQKDIKRKTSFKGKYIIMPRKGKRSKDKKSNVNKNKNRCLDKNSNIPNEKVITKCQVCQIF